VGSPKRKVEGKDQDNKVRGMQCEIKKGWGRRDEEFLWGWGKRLAGVSKSVLVVGRSRRAVQGGGQRPKQTASFLIRGVEWHGAESKTGSELTQPKKRGRGGTVICPKLGRRRLKGNKQKKQSRAGIPGRVPGKIKPPPPSKKHEVRYRPRNRERTYRKVLEKQRHRIHHFSRKGCQSTKGNQSGGKQRTPESCDEKKMKNLQC